MSKDKNGTVGWNSSYFGEAKPGSLAHTIADITNKQNDLVGGKPEVADSQAVQAAKAKEELAQEGKLPPALQKAIDAKKEKKEDEDMAQKEPKSKDKGPVKVHGEKNEDVNAEIEAAKQGKVKSLVDTIIDMYKTNEEGNAFGKALQAAKEKGETEFVVSGKKFNVEAELDKVNQTAVKKKFDDRKDKDIDNDGDVDSSDKFLHKRRKAISKAVSK
jgi:hypothetical protein|tara:strand:- start:687 stop:1334 length:648 start_codon:yes stop_codon:yes gene_type:complete